MMIHKTVFDLLDLRKMPLIESEDGWIVAFHSHNYKLMARHGWSSLIANYSYDLLSKTINIY